MIENGRTLITALDHEGIRPEAAFWFYFSETENWKLVLVHEKVGKEGPKKVYNQIQSIMSKMSEKLGDLSLYDITLKKTGDTTVKLLRSVNHIASKNNGKRLKNLAIRGTVIEDAYIYRL